ncbi:hypothetical protein [Polycyclovorans algicola]|uniref:hypothetical protein n=1 Tax=Polycyclovorans algicola TaxID=616992 RepID=UPI0004A6B0D1|nr:hypothetical protein [Polycyclovorans algicola]
MRVLISALSLALVACATTPTAPEPREPRRVASVIALPAPPAAHLCEADTRVCYTLPDAWALADTLDAAFALQDQAIALHTAAVALDAETVDLQRARETDAETIAALMDAHRRSTWAWRIGTAAVGALVLGVSW